jgi:hypothetical protein
MRRAASLASVLFLSLSLSGWWSQLWQLATGRAIHGRPVPTCGGNANPDGGPCH